MGQYNFEKDIKVGEAGEKTIIRFLETKGMIFENGNKDNKYDMKMFYPPIQKHYTYEIKTDELIKPGRDTGNLAVEYECRHKKSGIEVTEADYFLTYFYYLGEVWNIKTEKLKRMIERLNFKKVKGGDEGSDTWMYLIPREENRKYFKVYKITDNYL